MAIRTVHREVPPYRTLDGSEVRELMYPAVHGNCNQSLAEAMIPPGTVTALHLHRTSEELYSVLEGEGMMILGGESFPVAAGDTVCIPPGTPHRIENTGAGALKILCCCAPAYSHQDTQLLDEPK